MTAPTLDLPAAAALLHQHEHTVEAWARAGKVPAHRVGRRYVFITAELLAWIAAQPATRDAACRSTDAPAAATGGSSSARQAHRVKSRADLSRCRSQPTNGRSAP